MRQHTLLWICLACLSICQLVGSDSIRSAGITQVTVSRVSFNPTLGQTVSVSMQLCCRGALSMVVLDRDTFVVRHLAQGKAVMPGIHTVLWDGMDDRSVPLPNEAYTFRIELQTPEGKRVYDPADHFIPVLDSASAPTYSRVRAILHYTLKHSSRVHVQVGIAKPDAKTGVLTGAVLANPVDSEPRPAGSVIETWNGFLKIPIFLCRTILIFLSVFSRYLFRRIRQSSPETPTSRFGIMRNSTGKKMNWKRVTSGGLTIVIIVA